MINISKGDEYVRTGNIKIVEINNSEISVDRRVKFKANDSGQFPDLPLAYRTNPASVMLVRVNAGNWAPAENLRRYFEAVIKTILNL